MTQKGCFVRGRGRPTKLTPEISNRITEAIRKGNYAETAAGLAGVAKSTFLAWVTEGARCRTKDPKTLTDHQRDMMNFSIAVEKAIVEAEERDLDRIDKAAQGYDSERVKVVTDKDGQSEMTITKERRFEWQAAAWRLERRQPKKWGRRLDVNAGIVASPLDDRSDAELLSIINAGELTAAPEDETQAALDVGKVDIEETPLEDD